MPPQQYGSLRMSTSSNGVGAVRTSRKRNRRVVAAVGLAIAAVALSGTVLSVGPLRSSGTTAAVENLIDPSLMHHASDCLCVNLDGNNFRGSGNMHGKICNFWDDKPYPWCYVQSEDCVDASGRVPKTEFYNDHELHVGICTIVYGNDDCTDDTCNGHGLCIDQVDTVSCFCDDGFGGEFCASDINACTNNPCDPAAICDDIPAPALDNHAGRTCTCMKGYLHSDEAEDCVEINACHDFDCDANAFCQDLPAPAVNDPAGRTCKCNDGYTGGGEPRDCQDIDACVRNECDSNAICTDLPPPGLDNPSGRMCACKTGWDGSGERGECADVDACADNPCDVAATCTDQPPPNPNSPTGRTCKCAPGYEGLGGPGGCEDLDACQLSPCDNHADCNDRPPPADGSRVGRSCVCKPGWFGVGEPGQCADINACASHPCDARADCNDLPAPALDAVYGRTCTCYNGLTGSGEPGDCENVDSCHEHPCHDFAKCEDMPPPAGFGADGRTCTCFAGYTGTGERGFDGCKDVDACASSLNTCDANAVCADLPPPALDDQSGRTCTCAEGFTGSGEVGECMDLDACISTPCDPRADCRDLEAPAGAGTSGRTCTCQRGYFGSGEPGDCKDTNACEKNPCDNDAECTDMPAPAADTVDGRMCKCTTGFRGSGEPGECEDEDACLLYPCAENAVCSDRPAPAPNAQSGRQCSCEAGYEGAGFCQDFNTPDDQMYHYVDHPLGPNKALVLGVRAASDVHVGLFTSKQMTHGDKISGLKKFRNMYEIVIGGWGNSMSVIRRGMQGENEVQVKSEGVLNAEEMRYFWIDVTPKGSVQVGMGQYVGQDTLMQWQDPNPMAAKFVAVMTGWGANGQWHVCQPCTDKDACSDAPCDAMAKCHDLPPPALGFASGRQCVCLDGFEGSGEVGGCADADGCTNNPCDENAKCVDNPPPAGAESRECTCNAGFEGNGEPGGCADLDGCLTSPCDTNANCADAPAPAAADQRQCTCKRGYQGSGEPGACDDVDECAAGTHFCDPNAECTNTVGSHACHCNMGYAGDGSGCRDLDDCASEPCVHGTCQDNGPNSYLCECELGWGGRDCDDIIYRVTLTNGAGPQAETNDKVFVKLKGTGGETQTLVFSAIGLASGQTYTAVLAAQDVGDLRSMSYWQSGTDEVQPIAGSVSYNGKTLEAWGRFEWADDGDQQRRVNLSPPEALRNYTVTLWGGAGEAAGTTDMLFVALTGSDGETGDLLAFPYGLPRTTKQTATLRAPPVGELSSMTFSARGTDGLKIAGGLVQPMYDTVEGDPYAPYVLSPGKGRGPDAFDWAGQGNQVGSRTYDLLASDQDCTPGTVPQSASPCDLTALSAHATATASSQLDDSRGASKALGFDDPDAAGWAPLLKQDAEWLQLDFGEDVWIAAFKVAAGKVSSQLCSEGNGIYALQPPLCCEYLQGFQLEVMRDGDDSRFAPVGTYATGGCFAPLYAPLATPVLGRKFRFVTINTALTHWPSAKVEMYGTRSTRYEKPFSAPDFGQGVAVAAAGDLTAASVERVCECFKLQGPAGFAAGGACKGLGGGADVTVCPSPGAWDGGFAAPGAYVRGAGATAATDKAMIVGAVGADKAADARCRVRVNACEQSGFAATGLVGSGIGSEGACLDLAQQTYLDCGNTELGASPVPGWKVVTAAWLPTSAVRAFPGKLRILKATWGANCGTRPNNVMGKVRQWCEGQSTCSFKASIAAFGFDPAAGCKKTIDVRFACGVGKGAVVKTAKSTMDQAGNVVEVKLDCSEDVPVGEYIAGAVKVVALDVEDLAPGSLDDETVAQKMAVEEAKNAYATCLVSDAGQAKPSICEDALKKALAAAVVAPEGAVAAADGSDDDTAAAAAADASSPAAAAEAEAAATAEEPTDPSTLAAVRLMYAEFDGCVADMEKRIQTEGEHLKGDGACRLILDEKRKKCTARVTQRQADGEDLSTSRCDRPADEQDDGKNACPAGQFDNGEDECEACADLSGDCADCECGDFSADVQGNCKAACQDDADADAAPASTPGDAASVANGAIEAAKAQYATCLVSDAGKADPSTCEEALKEALIAAKTA